MVRIQLASNFQVLELTAESVFNIDFDELERAVEVVNELGSKVKNDIKTAPKTTENEKRKKDELASEKQIKYAVNLGLDEKEARKMTKGQIWSYIKRTREEWDD